MRLLSFLAAVALGTQVPTALFEIELCQGLPARFVYWYGVDIYLGCRDWREVCPPWLLLLCWGCFHYLVRRRPLGYISDLAVS